MRALETHHGESPTAQSGDVSSGASQTAAPSVESWELLADAGKLALKQLKPRLEHLNRLAVVSEALAALEAIAKHAGEQDHSRQSDCVVVLRASLQEACSTNKEQLREDQLVQRWLKVQLCQGTEAGHHVKLVSYNSLLAIACYQSLVYKQQC